ncbi:MAG TPA: response regulator transcription factor [Pirellulaceae bacterium]|jgi:DNA-binding NarL/FixJ family response regulator|nr:response regulator transcription factor [Pirellulaceae bacterium]
MNEKSGSGACRLLIVDDHAGVRTALQRMLSLVPDVQVVGVAESGEEAIALAAAQRPTVVLMDVEMPGIGGVEATRRLKSLLPDLRVIGYSSDDRAEPMRAAGAAAFVRKGDPPERLLEAIRADGQ